MVPCCSVNLLHPSDMAENIKTTAICAGIAGIIGAGIGGFLLGRRYGSKVKATSNFQAKSHYNKNPLMEYVMEHSLREPEPLRKVKEATLEYGYMTIMLTAAEEAQLFRLLFPYLNAKKVIEVGTYTGYNTLNMAICLPPGGKVVTLDVTDEHLKAVKFWEIAEEAGLKEKIDLRIKPATETLDELIAAGEAGTYDFVFIDADKPSYDAYYEKSLQLLRTGGMIVIDNVLYFERVLKPYSEMNEGTRAIDALNKKVHKDARVDMAMLPFADGVTLVTKK